MLVFGGAHYPLPVRKKLAIGSAMPELGDSARSDRILPSEVLES